MVLAFAALQAVLSNTAREPGRRSCLIPVVDVFMEQSDQPLRASGCSAEYNIRMQ